MSALDEFVDILTPEQPLASLTGLGLGGPRNGWRGRELWMSWAAWLTAAEPRGCRFDCSVAARMSWFPTTACAAW